MKNGHRRFSRIPFRVNAEITFPDSSHTVREMNNLSVGGCLLPLSMDLEPGTPCRIKIMLEGTTDEKCIRAEGKVIRSTPEGVAVQFTGIDPDSLFHLQNIIRYNSPDADMIEFELSKHPGLK